MNFTQASNLIEIKLLEQLSVSVQLDDTTDWLYEPDVAELELQTINESAKHANYDLE